MNKELLKYVKTQLEDKEGWAWRQRAWDESRTSDYYVKEGVKFYISVCKYYRVNKLVEGLPEHPTFWQAWAIRSRIRKILKHLRDEKTAVFMKTL